MFFYVHVALEEGVVGMNSTGGTAGEHQGSCYQLAVNARVQNDIHALWDY